MNMFKIVRFLHYWLIKVVWNIIIAIRYYFRWKREVREIRERINNFKIEIGNVFLDNKELIGTIGDFNKFIKEHRGGIRVIEKLKENIANHDVGVREKGGKNG